MNRIFQCITPYYLLIRGLGEGYSEHGLYMVEAQNWTGQFFVLQKFRNTV